MDIGNVTDEERAQAMQLVEQGQLTLAVLLIRLDARVGELEVPAEPVP